MSDSIAPLEYSIEDVRALISHPDQRAVVLDVREPWEWALSRLPGSQSIPMAQIPSALAELPRDRPLLILCHHGQRSERVTHYLRANGFPLASNIAGGIDAWSSADPGVPRY